MTKLLSPQHGELPVPVPSRFSAPYWEGCDLDELRFLRCGGCGQALGDAPRVCWRCHSRDLRWETSSGRGRLYSWTVVWRPQTPAFEVPYAPAVVEMVEGFHLMSAVIGCEPADLAADMALTVEFHPTAQGQKLPYFRPAPGR